MARAKKRVVETVPPHVIEVFGSREAYEKEMNKEIECMRQALKNPAQRRLFKEVLGTGSLRKKR